MERLKRSLEDLDEAISVLEDKVGSDRQARTTSQKKLDELIRQARAREANVMATAQKVALRLDQTIEHVEKILKD